MDWKTAWTLVAGTAVVAALAGCASAPVQAQRTASPMSSQELEASCRALAADDPSSAPQLTFVQAETLVGSAVPVCIVPKPGVDGAPRLEEASSVTTKAPGWSEAASLDRPLPDGVAVSRSSDAYVYVNGGWLLARMTGVGTSA